MTDCQETWNKNRRKIGGKSKLAGLHAIICWCLNTRSGRGFRPVQECKTPAEGWTSRRASESGLRVAPRRGRSGGGLHWRPCSSGRGARSRLSPRVDVEGVVALDDLVTRRRVLEMRDLAVDRGVRRLFLPLTAARGETERRRDPHRSSGVGGSARLDSSWKRVHAWDQAGSHVAISSSSPKLLG